MQQNATGRVRRRGRFGLWLLLSLGLIAVGAGFGLLALTGRPLPAPDWAVARVETRVNQLLAPGAHLKIGGVELLIDGSYVPRVRLRDVELLGAGGEVLASLPEVRVTLAVEPLLTGQIRLTRLRLSGARLILRRAADGRVDLGLGALPQAAAGDVVPGPQTMAEVLDSIDAAFATPILAGLERIDADALTLTLDDRRARRVWQVSDGRLTLVQDAESVSIELGFGLAGGNEDPARAVVTFVSRKGSTEARIAARVDGVAAADIAGQVPALAWLSVLDAPISGDVRASIDASGQIAALDGALTLGSGAVRPTPETRPVPFDRGTLYFTYNPKLQKVTFSELTVESPAVRLSAKGQAYLTEMEGGLPHAFLVQVSFSDVMVDPEGLFAEPARFSQGALDLRLRLDPFDITLGQLVLIEGGRRMEAKGRLGATPKGWDVSLDFALDAIAHDRLLALWPVGLVPGTRNWIESNVTTGLLFDVKAALRLHPGQPQRLSLGYEFSGADVRFMKTLPPVDGGHGYASIEGDTYTLVLDRGTVAAPQGGAIDVTGSVFRVPDITVPNAPAEIDLKVKGPITAALSILDLPPFGFLTKAGQAVDIADGRVDLDAKIRLPLAETVMPEDVDFDVSGTLADVRSDRIVPGRMLSADSLEVRVNPARIEITGSGALDGVPFHGAWTQGLRPEDAGRSRVEGSVELSQRFVDTFGIGLPAGSVAGTGEGDVTIELDRGKAPVFHMVSDLNRLQLSIPAVGWSKPRPTLGRLEVDGTLGTPPEVTRLVAEAPGLSATGRVVLKPDGALDMVDLSRVKLGGWFDGPVRLLGRGPNRPVGVQVSGGTVDIRSLPAGGGDAGEAVPVSLTLDRLRVSDTISLTGFRGDFSTAGGFNGRFTGHVNGGTLITGAVAPSRGRSAVRIQADDAGAAIADAGLFPNARKGKLDLTLIPRKGTSDFDGQMRITDVRVKNVPVLAELLNAISVVGLISTLQNAGLEFTQVDAEFRLTPDAVEVTHGAAVGISLGVSAAGTYDLNSSTFNIQGVVSPLYLLNVVGSVLTREGEGLFGFNYKLRGTAETPKVSVNLLSILTPGMFRDIFRAPPPKLPGDEK